MPRNSITIKHWSEADKPREKLRDNGARFLSDAELLAIIIGSGTQDMNAVDLSKILISNVDYNLRFPSDNYIEAFKWAENVPFIGEKLSETRFFYTPSTFTTGIRVNRNLSEKISRKNSELIEDFSLGLERRFTFNYKVFDNTQLNYTKNLRSDMSDYRDEVLNQLKVGALTNINETLNYTFSPQWLNWFKPNFSYNTNYSWNQPRNGIFDAANLNLVKNSGVNFSISPTEFIEIFYTPVSKREGPKTPSRTRSSGLASFNAEEDSEKKVEPKEKVEG